MTIKRIVLSSMVIILVWLSTAGLAIAETRAKTYWVNSDTSEADANPGDLVCATFGGKCTLRAAIQESNADGQASTIRFSTNYQTPHDIDGCMLPEITAPNTTIDASDRWDTIAGRPGVEISGPSCDLLKINASNNTILGLFLAGDGSIGINVASGNSNTIGGTGPGQRNVFLTSKYGVFLQGWGTSNAVVNNYFGTNDGEGIPGGIAGIAGIYSYTEKSTISNNLFVGYRIAGIYLDHSDENVISDNIIGLSHRKNKALGNEVGIAVIHSKSNLIGSNNIVAGNNSHGIHLKWSEDTTISGNKIGYKASTVGIGNGGDGIHLHIGTRDTINDGNSVNFNTGNGVYVLSSFVTIQGNGFTDNGKDGILIASTDIQVGGSTDQERNIISANKGNGIHLVGASNVTISGNYIGLDDAGGWDYGNEGNGILVENGSTNNLIGGIASGEGNLIAYNHQSGIQIQGGTTSHNQVFGNVLGAPINFAWEAGNGWHGIGIYNGAHDNHIGSILGGSGNTILASGWSGVAIVNSSNNTVVGNRIGTNNSGVQLGNAHYGVNVVGTGSGNGITYNTIAYNGTRNGQDGAEAGIEIDGSVSNPISQNSIHHNDGPGIRLVNGGNTMLPAPSITTASCEGPVSGTAGGPLWVIEIFSDGSDEGQYFEGTVTADPGGAWSWIGKPKGPFLTATARAQSDDTSRFSVPFKVGVCYGQKIYLPLVVK